MFYVGHFAKLALVQMMRRYKIMNKTTLLLFLLAASGCSNRVRVYAEYDSSFSLNEFSTFDWGKPIPASSAKDSLLNNVQNNKRIKSAIAGQLQLRGYAPTRENPDFKIYYHIIAHDQSVMDTESFGYSYSFFWTQLGTNIFPYGEGTLIIDCLDTKTNNLIWRGWTVSPLENANTSEDMDELIKTRVTRIFKKFPNTSKHAYVRDDKI